MLYVGVNRRRASEAFLIFEFHDSQESYSAKYTIILSIWRELEARTRTKKRENCRLNIGVKKAISVLHPAILLCIQIES